MRSGKDSRPGRGSSASSVTHNRRTWDRTSAEYDRRHRRALGGSHAMAWGLWRIPESKLGLLGEVRDLAVLELGCGAARWSTALARRGAQPTGLDLSREQLRRASAHLRASGVRFPLVRASAERTPFASGSFDLIFSDWGALSFGDPERTVPECARLLRPGGRLVLATGGPIGEIVYDRRRQRSGRVLRRPYFELGRIDAGSAEPIVYLPTYGRWVELLVSNGFAVERLIETRPDPGSRSSYLSAAATRFGHSWPLELIWSARRATESGPTRSQNPRRRGLSARAGR